MSQGKQKAGKPFINGKLIAAMRSAADLSTEQLAAKIDISVSGIRNIEQHGVRPFNPSTLTLVKLAVFFDVPIDDLVFRDNVILDK